MYCYECEAQVTMLKAMNESLSDILKVLLFYCGDKVFIIYLQKPIQYWNYSGLSSLAEKGVQPSFCADGSCRWYQSTATPSLICLHVTRATRTKPKY